MNKTKLKDLLKEFDKVQVDNYVEYCQKINDEKDKKTGSVKNPWFISFSDEYLEKLYRKNNATGLIFDGQHVAITKKGITYDYHSYKSKMLMIYPESVIDVQLVREGDLFNFQKDSGSVIYTHKIGDPFANKPVIGGYCVIKNRRGEFLTLLSDEDFQKHKAVAEMDYIWKQWPDEMKTKTLMKKGCKHFGDDFKDIEALDNDNYDLSKLDKIFQLSEETLTEIENIATVEACVEYYKANKDKYSELKEDFIKELAKRKAQILEGF